MQIEVLVCTHLDTHMWNVGAMAGLAPRVSRGPQRRRAELLGGRGNAGQGGWCDPGPERVRQEEVGEESGRPAGSWGLGEGGRSSSV